MNGVKESKLAVSPILAGRPHMWVYGLTLCSTQMLNKHASHNVDSTSTHWWLRVQQTTGTGSECCVEPLGSDKCLYNELKLDYNRHCHQECMTSSSWQIRWKHLESHKHPHAITTMVSASVFMACAARQTQLGMQLLTGPSVVIIVIPARGDGTGPVSQVPQS